MVTLRLLVDTDAWERQVSATAASIPGLVPVVKGNGYGFGRRELAFRARHLADTIAVGTVHELADTLDAAMGVELRILVLTPTLQPPRSTDPILTIGAPEHLDALGSWRGSVIVKLESSMRRFGRGLELVDAAREAGQHVLGVAIHPPLVGTDSDHLGEIHRWLAEIDPALTVWVSHLSATAYASLPDSHRFRLRLGTELWIGDRSALQLVAEVLDRRPVRAGDRVGYRLDPVPVDGTLVMIATGTANGVHPLPDGRSPFHFARRRLALVEPPHMHTSMAVVPDGDPCPEIGERVDVQQPLTTTHADVVDWR